MLCLHIRVSTPHGSVCGQLRLLRLRAQGTHCALQKSFGRGFEVSIDGVSWLVCLFALLETFHSPFECFSLARNHDRLEATARTVVTKTHRGKLAWGLRSAC